MDHLPFASTSAVGTYHNPVSPKNVVVAGRVSSELDDCVRLSDVFCPVDVPVEPVCAFALAAKANVTAQATTTRLAIVCRLQSRSSAGALHSALFSLKRPPETGAPLPEVSSAGVETIRRPRPPRLTCPPFRPAE